MHKKQGQLDLHRGKAETIRGQIEDLEAQEAKELDMVDTFTKKIAELEGQIRALGTSAGAAAAPSGVKDLGKVDSTVLLEALGLAVQAR